MAVHRGAAVGMTKAAFSIELVGGSAGGFFGGPHNPQLEALNMTDTAKAVAIRILTGQPDNSPFRLALITARTLCWE